MPSWGRSSWCGATTNTAADKTVTPSQVNERARHADAAATSRNGATHTQWCDQDVGETRSATPAVAISASGGGARRIAGAANASTPTDSTSHSTVFNDPSAPALTSTDWKVWFVKNGEPLTPPAGLSSQNFQDGPGATRNARPVTSAPDAAATAAARYSRRRRK